jgi:MATE family multidrug resistance protein
MLASITVPLIGIADTAMVGRLPDVAFLGAVAAASMLFDLLFWSAGFLRMGTTSLVAQHFGAGDRRACAEVLYRSLLIALVLGGVMLLLRQFIAEFGFSLIGGSAEVQEWGKRYFAIRSWGVPLVLIIFTLNGFFLGTGNAVVPMCLTFIATSINVAADYALIFGAWGAPQLGVLGAAWAAVLANLVAVITGLLLLVKSYGAYLKEKTDDLLARSKLVLLLRTNVNLFGRTLCLLFAQYAMVSLVARMGEVPLAAHAIIWQIWGLVSYGVDGFAHAAETLVGGRLGARDFAGARRISWRIIQWGIGIGLGFSLLYGLAIEPIARGFTAHQEVIEQIIALTYLIVLVQPLNAVVFVFDGIFIGANDMAYLFKAMGIASFGVFVPLAFICVYWLGWGMPGAWLAYNGLMLGRFFTLLPRYRGDQWLRTFVH